jgi:hypothetical protein
MGVRAVLNACHAGILLAALTPPIVFHASHAAGARCAAPVVEVVPRPGGHRQFRIQSPCRKGELVIGLYDQVVIMERFDENGALAFDLDCFLGDRDVDLTFADNWRTRSHACSAVESALTKVAIVWKDRVDLDLHAFEYAALPGSRYDRSARNPGSYQTAESEYVQSGRSHGFMSTVSDGQQLGHNIEVYTLLLHPTESRGLVAMAVGLGAYNDAETSGSCGNGRREPLRVDFDVYVLEQGSRLRSYERTFTAQSCDGGAAHLVTNLIPSIVLGTAGASARAQ